MAQTGPQLDRSFSRKLIFGRDLQGQRSDKWFFRTPPFSVTAPLSRSGTEIPACHQKLARFKKLLASCSPSSARRAPASCRRAAKHGVSPYARHGSPAAGASKRAAPPAGTGRLSLPSERHLKCLGHSGRMREHWINSLPALCPKPNSEIGLLAAARVRRDGDSAGKGEPSSRETPGARGRLSSGS